MIPVILLILLVAACRTADQFYTPINHDPESYFDEHFGD